jgi:hypothetical protein
VRLLTFLVYIRVIVPLATGRWYSPDPPVSSSNKTIGHDLTELLLKVTLNIITLTLMGLSCAGIVNKVTLGLGL